MNKLLVWLQATRPKTLFISAAPAVIGSTLSPHFDFWIFFYTLLTALGIQITSHFASDYFDHLNGADTSSRKGFVKVLQVGLVKVESMKRAVICSALATTIVGSYIVWIGGPIIATFLVLGIALGILYNGGPYPISYLGISEFIAFAFYGPVAVMGAYYLQTGSVTFDVFLAGVTPGAYAASIMMINNLRDVEEDRSVDKKTFPVRFGRNAGKAVYVITMLVALTMPLLLNKYLPLLLVLPAFLLVRAVLTIKEHQPYDSLFKKTTLMLVAHTVLFCL